MAYLFTSESVSEGHPDKVADQISDALIDHFLAFDPDSKVACETLVTTGQVVLAGEVKSNTYLDVQKIARETINKIGYTKSEYMFDGNSCGVFSAIHEQSEDINRGVDRETKEEQGAGDQGMMFGYATRETENYMPLALDLAHLILKELAELRRENKEITYLRPDSKSQVTIEYSDDNVPQRIDAIVLSTQHDDFDATMEKEFSDHNLVCHVLATKEIPGGNGESEMDKIVDEFGEIVEAVEKRRQDVSKSVRPDGIPTVKPTVNNPVSSRSILFYEFEVQFKGLDKTHKLVIIDLPGKEEIFDSYISQNPCFEKLGRKEDQGVDG